MTSIRGTMAKEVARRREEEADCDYTNMAVGLPRHANASGQCPAQTVTLGQYLYCTLLNRIYDLLPLEL